MKRIDLINKSLERLAELLPSKIELLNTFAEDRTLPKQIRMRAAEILTKLALAEHRLDLNGEFLELKTTVEQIQEEIARE